MAKLFTVGAKLEPTLRVVRQNGHQKQILIIFDSEAIAIWHYHCLAQ